METFLLIIILLAFGVPYAYFVFGISNRHNTKSKAGNKVSKERYDELLMASMYGRLYNSKDTIIDCFDEDDKIYITKMFSEWSKIYKEWSKDFLTANLRPLQPISPTTSAFIGSKIGGTAVGVAAAMDAQKKKENYEQAYSKYISEESNRMQHRIDIKIKYGEIVYEIESNESAKKLWGKIKEEVETKHKQEYTIEK